MIIEIRGTSGSGKSTVMRRVMELMGEWDSVFVAGRKRPLYYRSCSEWPSTAVLGHYESPCGGCDTIGSAAAVFALASKVLAEVEHVLCEGLLLSEDVKWTKQMENVRGIFLTTPLERCLSQIRSRRETAGNDRPLNEENTTKRVGVIERARGRLVEAGVYCRRASAVQAPKIVLDWIRQATR